MSKRVLRGVLFGLQIFQAILGEFVSVDQSLSSVTWTRAPSVESNDVRFVQLERDPVKNIL